MLFLDHYHCIFSYHSLGLSIWFGWNFTFCHQNLLRKIVAKKLQKCLKFWLIMECCWLQRTALLLADVPSEMFRVTLWQTENVQNLIGYYPIRTLSDVILALKSIGKWLKFLLLLFWMFVLRKIVHFPDQN